MANRLKMAIAQSILTLHERGWSARRIARELQVNRETVSRHVRLAGQATSAEPGGDGSNLANAPTGGSVRQHAQIGLQSLPGRFVRNSGAA